MKREELEEKSLKDILNIVNKKHGLTRGNSLVAREMTRIYNKSFIRSFTLKIKREAAIRVLCGLKDAENIIIDSATFENNNIITNINREKNNNCN